MGLCSSKREIKFVLIGLDLAGKTSILNKLRFNDAGSTTPTVGFNYETVTHKNVSYDISDTGGQDKLRDLWRHYYEEANGVVFAVDSTDEERLNCAKEELHKAMHNINLNKAFLCVLANKRDLDGCMSIDTITRGLDLESFTGKHEWTIMETNALKGAGLYAALEWMASLKI